jgi:hypothetical protein
VGNSANSPFIAQVTALLVAAAVLFGCLNQFAQYYFKGKRSRNPSYLAASAGLLFFFFSMLASDPLRAIMRALLQSTFQFMSFLAGCVFLIMAIVLFLYMTYLRPNRLRFEDRLVEDLPAGPPDEE